jgi:hypothetical protein
MQTIRSKDRKTVPTQDHVNTVNTATFHIFKMPFCIVTLLTIRSSAHSKHVVVSLLTKVTYVYHSYVLLLSPSRTMNNLGGIGLLS